MEYADPTAREFFTSRNGVVSAPEPQLRPAEPDPLTPIKTLVECINDALSLNEGAFVETRRRLGPVLSDHKKDIRSDGVDVSGQGSGPLALALRGILTRLEMLRLQQLTLLEELEV